MTVTIPNVLRSTYQNISQFQWQSQSFGQLNRFEAIAFVPGEPPMRIPLDAGNKVETILNDPLARNVASTNSERTNPNKLNIHRDRVGGGRGQCNQETVSGGNIPDYRIIDIGQANLTIKFTYDTYDIKDKIDVYYMNRQIFSTGCVGAKGATYLPLNGYESTLRIRVTPNCAGDTGTAWEYSIECPKELICEDNICYCGFNRQNSVQIKRFPPNGCGGEGSPLSFLIHSIGKTWGFTLPCNDHDDCYGECNSLRNTCDRNWFSKMWLSCRKFALIDPRLYPCPAWANIFYVSVRIFGTRYFASSQRKSCKCNTTMET
jgi:hypothetical protein